ncbi:Hypothetical protein DEACI_1124 [Acididesulfobacillus acetoxydans]|uniref:Uncharacterized protein n=1 Tax=Acididesulfobacillus acetoxydans TaxID=1561005 RepID=A0A8S0WWR5_9FIRM|nr:Hypothetical protein DEACI_1124 [Acididesulfobacillus acetoxydans]CEJ06605.1 Hypothetical protein DEACI_1054 [Acididesulfobacillus acetoxydans]
MKAQDKAKEAQKILVEKEGMQRVKANVPPGKAWLPHPYSLKQRLGTDTGPSPTGETGGTARRERGARGRAKGGLG